MIGEAKDRKCTIKGGSMQTTITFRKDRMLRVIAAPLVILWFAGLLSGYTMDLFIHLLIALAIILLVISVNLEVSIYRDLTHTLHGYRYRKINSEETGL
jgi:hypothetical protein